MELLPKLKKEKQADVLITLMSYIYPKRKAVEISIEQQSQTRVIVHIPSNGRELPGTVRELEESD